MTSYLSGDFRGGPFILFSIPHLSALTVIAFLIVLIYLFRYKLYNLKNHTLAIISSLLILQQFSLCLWYVYYGNLPLKAALPLELCDVSLIISAVMFFTKSYFLFEIVYFWGLAGSLEALITPDLGIYTFPHFVFFQFFLSHGSIVIISLFMIFVYGYTPTFKSMLKSLFVLNLYAAFIGIYDKLMGTNFMFLCDKTQDTSIMSFIGPWPWYLISLEFVAIISCILCLIPFAVKNKLHKDRIHISQ